MELKLWDVTDGDSQQFAATFSQELKCLSAVLNFTEVFKDLRFGHFKQSKL